MSRLKKISRKIYGPENRRGATAIIVAIVLVVLLGVAALAVDIGYLYAAKNELQNAADAAALAGARQLGNIYSLLSVAEQMSYDCDSDDQTLIKNTAIDVASQNNAATLSVVISADEVEIGQWVSGVFTATTNQPDAVRVTAKRDGSTGATIGTFFARVLGINDAGVVADATAALTAQSTTTEGELELPFGISKARFSSEYCNKPIKFSPTGTLEGCAGWHTFEDEGGASTLRDIIDNITDGSDESPGTVAGVTEFEFTGGVVANAFDNLRLLLEDRDKIPDGPMYFKDGNIGEFVGSEWVFYDSGTAGADLVTDNKGDSIPRREWTTGVVVYDFVDCGNPTGSIKIVGYASVTLWCVLDTQVNPPDAKKTIIGQIVCDGYYDGRGGGSSSYGTKGTIPGLVE